MNWPVLVAGAFVLAMVAGFLYWQINLAEGVYMGRRVVVWLYDRYASRYDAVKKFNDNDEAWFLGAPLAEALKGVSTSLVLDVATGTGRLPLALFRQPAFSGRIIALDLSRKMLRQTAIKTSAYRDRLTLLLQDATQLPFPNEVFNAVTCLEALEFVPDSHATLAEMVRVLRPGGILLISNRIGPGVRWMPGRTMSRPQLIALLESMSLRNVSFGAWQIDYDMIWVRKPVPELWTTSVHALDLVPATLPHLLCCPRCANTPLSRQDKAFRCNSCNGHYPITEDGVIEMRA
jgi:SAM-dependent methyltransferase